MAGGWPERKNLRPVFPLFLPQLRNFTSVKLQIRAGVFSRVLLADLMGARVIGCGRKRLCPNAIKGGYLTSKASVFRQTGPDLKLFSMRIQSERFTGFSGRGPDHESQNRARYSRILDEFPVPDRTQIGSDLLGCQSRIPDFHHRAISAGERLTAGAKNPVT